MTVIVSLVLVFWRLPRHEANLEVKARAVTLLLTECTGGGSMLEKLHKHQSIQLSVLLLVLCVGYHTAVDFQVWLCFPDLWSYFDVCVGDDGLDSSRL